MERIELRIDPQLDATFPRQRAARVAITAGGRREELVQPTRKGDPDAPLTDADLNDKFLELVAPVLGGEQATPPRRAVVDKVTLAQALFAPRCVALIGASGDAPRTPRAAAVPAQARLWRPNRSDQRHARRGARRARLSRRGRCPRRGRSRLHHGRGRRAGARGCARKGVKVASIYSNGFADAGPDGVERQRRLTETARKLGVRLLGPNSMGVVNLPGGVALTVNAVLEMGAPLGGTSLVSQSGTMLGTLLSRGAARGLGYREAGVDRQRGRPRRRRDRRAAGRRRGYARDRALPGDGARCSAPFFRREKGACGRQARRRVQAWPQRPRRGARALAHRRARRHRCGARRLLPRLRHRARRHAGDAGRDPAFSGGQGAAAPGAHAEGVGGDDTGGGAASVVDRLGLHGIELGS